MEDLRQKLQHELTKQDVQLDRLDREKQEESNLVAMLQLDIERLNNDRYNRRGFGLLPLWVHVLTVKTEVKCRRKWHVISGLFCLLRLVEKLCLCITL